MSKNTKTKAKRPARKAEITHVIILLDRTGSMQSVKDDTIGGFNSYLDGLDETNLLVRAVQFDDQSRDQIFDFCEPENATRLTAETYQPRANTPLFDAIGETIREMRARSKSQKVMIVVLTDGQENASKEFTYDSVRALMKEAEERDKWTFAFIAQGLSAKQQAGSLCMGMNAASNIKTVAHDKAGTKQAYRSLARATVSYCSSAGGQTVNSIFKGDPSDE